MTHRLSLTLRALLLVPLMAVGIDQVRALALCGPDAQSCLEAAGRGWIGAAGAVLVVVYALALGLWLAGAARRERSRRPAFVPLWAAATGGLAVACAGQALLAGGALGGPAELLALCAAAGAVVAAVLRWGPAAAEQLVRTVRAPRLTVALADLPRSFAPPRAAIALGSRRPPRGRAPPAAV